MRWSWWGGVNVAKAKGILLFYDWAEAFDELPPKDCKALLMAMFAFAQDGTPPPEFAGKARMAAGFIFPALERAKRVSEARSAAGKSGNDTRWKKPGEGGKNVANVSQNGRKPIANESQNIATKQNKTKQNNTKHTPLPPEGAEAADAAGCVCLESFEKFWEKYPKKTARKEALTIWQALDPDEALIERILAAVDAQSATQAWQTEGGRYVPMAAVWLEGERWNDEVAPPRGDGGEEGASTFDVDEFWEAALAKSYGESEVHP